MNNYKQKLEKFLNPEILNQNLIIASLYIAVFDNFKYRIISSVRDFYISGYKDGQYLYDGYKDEVLNKIKTKNNRTIKASILWLKESGAITNADETKFEELTNMRNNLAHEMSQMLFDGFPDNIYQLYVDMIELFEKIEKWWVIEVEMAINSTDIPYKNIDWNNITSVNIQFIKIMSQIAFTNTNEYKNIVENMK